MSQNERKQQADKDIYIYIHRTYLFKVALPFASSANLREFETLFEMRICFFYLLLFASKSRFCPKRYAKIKERFYSRGNEGKRNLLFSLVQQQQYKRDCSIFFFKLTPLSLSLSLSVCVCVSFINAGSRNKSPPPAPPRSCSSTPPRPTPKSWASRSKTASRTPRRKSLSNLSFRTEDRLSTSRRTGPRISRLLTGDWRRTWRDRMLGARRLPARRAWTSRVVRRNNLKFVKICD